MRRNGKKDEGIRRGAGEATRPECRQCHFSAICLPIGRERLGFTLGKINTKDTTPCGAITEFIEGMERRMREFERGVRKTVPVDRAVLPDASLYGSDETGSDKSS